MTPFLAVSSVVTALRAREVVTTSAAVRALDRRDSHMGMFARRGRTARKQALLDELDQAARKICAHPGCESAQPSNRPTPSLHCQRLPVAQFYPSFHVASPDPTSISSELELLSSFHFSFLSP